VGVVTEVDWVVLVFGEIEDGRDQIALRLAWGF
jgi:hypothetical protein